MEPFENKKAVISGNLHPRLFTISVKDNISIMEDFHGTNMPLFQFTSTVNLGANIYYENLLKFHKQTVERWDN